MGLSPPWADSLYITFLQSVTILSWVNPMRLSVPMSNLLDIIAFQTAKIN